MSNAFTTTLDDKSRWELLQSLTEDDVQAHLIMPLLRAMGYSNVELRHGPAEYGKDVIAIKSDALMLTRVAFVVKVGNISGQTAKKKDVERLEDVRTQVKKAFEMPYTDIYTKQEQDVNRVIVWTTGTISSNAREEIIRNLRTEYATNVNYIDGHRTIELLNQYYPSFFAFRDSELGEYYRRAERDFNRIDALRTIGTSSERTTLTNLFVTPDFIPLFNTNTIITRSGQRVRGRVKPSPTQRKHRDERVNLQELINNQQQQLHKHTSKHNILILGDGGSGKSTILRQVLLMTIKQNQEKRNPNNIPIFIELKNLDLTHPTPITHAIHQQYSQDPTLVTAIDILDGKFLLLLDALDECTTEERFMSVLQTIATFIHTYPKTPIIMTSRFTNLLDPNVHKTLLPTFRPYRIAQFSLEKMTKFIRNWFHNDSSVTCEKLIQYVSHPNGLYGLPATPLTMAVVATLFESGQQELPANLTELFHKYFELLLGRWDSDKALHQQIEWRVKQKFLSDFTWHHLHQHRRDTFMMNEFGDKYLQWARDRGLDTHGQAQFVAEINRSEILISKGQKVEFKHRTFQEYFAGMAIADNKQEVFRLMEQSHDDWWYMTIFFACGSKPDNNDYLHHFIEKGNPHSLGYAIHLGFTTQAMYLSSRTTKREAVLRVLDTLTSVWNQQAHDLSSKYKNLNWTLQHFYSQANQALFFALHIFFSLGSHTLAPVIQELADEILADTTLTTPAQDWIRYLLGSALFCAGNIEHVQRLIEPIRNHALLSAFHFLLHIENVVGFFDEQNQQTFKHLRTILKSKIMSDDVQQSIQHLFHVAPITINNSDDVLLKLMAPR